MSRENRKGGGRENRGKGGKKKCVEPDREVTAASRAKLDGFRVSL